MLTIKYVNIPPAARSTKFRQKAKSTLKLLKWVDGQASAENQKAAENSAAWWENSLLRHGAVKLLRVRRRTVVNVNERLRLEGDVCQRRPICAMKTEPLGVVKGLIVI